MILRTVYVRFYRAFNFDYLRKSHPDATPNVWDVMDDGRFYPYVKLDIAPELTAIVGANESGKSQLLQAVEYALEGRNPEPGDFCRYSELFTVAEAMRLPHFGLHFGNLTSDEAQAISELVGLSDSQAISSFRLFRTLPEKATLYIGEEKHEVTDLSSLSKILPRVFRIAPDRAIPNSVPLSFLIAGGGVDADLGVSRIDRWNIFGPMIDRISEVFSQPQNPQALGTAVQSILADVGAPARLSDQEAETYRNQMNLAYDLL